MFGRGLAEDRLASTFPRMFADACEKGRNFTRPVVTFWFTADGDVKSGVGSLVVVNAEGWFLSAYHIWKTLASLGQATKAAKEHKAKIDAIKNDQTLNHGRKKNALAQLGDLKGDAPLVWAVQWIADGVQVVDVSYLEGPDLMLGRLEPFDPKSIAEYPTFREPAGIRQGTSLVRMGFPFPNVEATYEATKNSFSISKRELPVFPIEGIYTRNVFIKNNAAGYKEMFLETSSPGLKGQSGGPILDTKGLVWSIQSNTQNLSLGFDPVVPKQDGKKKADGRKEHQFLNVGWGAHPETVIGFMKEKGINYAVGV